jgi:tripartite-type tricarboxylate transporter receptor subunit TctC
MFGSVLTFGEPTKQGTKTTKTVREQVMRIARMLSYSIVALLAMGFTTPAQAQGASDYPNRPIRVIVSNSAGSSVDITARIMAEAVKKYLGQGLVTENKPGGGQRLGASLVAKSPPDGYTLLFTSPTPIVVAQFFPPKLGFDPARDFRPLAAGVFQPVLLVVRPTLGVKTVDEFVAYAKSNPGKISFGVPGMDGEMYLSLELFKRTAGMDIRPIPYNAAPVAIADLLAGRLDAKFLVLPPIKGYLESGKLLALATLNDTRIALLPYIPTMMEIGRPEMTNAIWFGYLAPAKTPDSVIEKLARAFGQLQSDAALRKRVAELGAELNTVGPAEFGKIIETDRRRYGKIVADGNLAKQN